MTTRTKSPAANESAHLLADNGQIESLESRLLLAGNLRVTVSAAGDVSIRGDGRSNYVEIAREVTDQNGDGDNQDIVVRGLNDIAGTATGIRDGRNVVSQVVINANQGSLSGNVKISLGGGNDFLVMRNVKLNGDFTFQPGGGSDSFGFFDGSAANGYSRFRTGGGNDYLNVVGSSFNGTWDLNTGGGVDYIGFSDYSSANGALTKIVTGGSPDVIYIEDSIVDGDFDIDMGSLIDTIYVADGTVLKGNVVVDMGSLFDLLVLENNVNFSQATLNVSGGSGGFGYNNLLFVYDDSPYVNNIPAGFTGFEVDFYTISGNSTTGFDLSTTLSKWIMDLYYSSQPDISIDVVDTFLAANIARGFTYGDLPRSDQGPAPNPGDIADEVTFFLNEPSFYGYQRFFVRGVFNTEISSFNWNRF